MKRRPKCDDQISPGKNKHDCLPALVTDLFEALSYRSQNCDDIILSHAFVSLVLVAARPREQTGALAYSFGFGALLTLGTCALSARVCCIVK